MDAGGNIWTQEGECEENYVEHWLVAILSSTDPTGSATCSQGIRGYVSVKATLKFTLYI